MSLGERNKTYSSDFLTVNVNSSPSVGSCFLTFLRLENSAKESEQIKLCSWCVSVNKYPIKGLKMILENRKRLTCLGLL